MRQGRPGNSSQFGRGEMREWWYATESEDQTVTNMSTNVHD